MKMTAWLLAVAAAVPPRAAPEVELVVSMDKSEFLSSEPIRLTVELRVLSRWPIMFNPVFDARYWEVIVRPVDGGMAKRHGEIIDLDVPVCNYPVFHKLRSISWEVNLNRPGGDPYLWYFELGPGTYNVEVVYDTSVDFEVLHECGKFHADPAFLHSARSKPLKFRIVPDSAPQVRKTEKALVSAEPQPTPGP
jgi:hypothetical protein